jgi:diacylglycerol kinase (ATP)
MRKPNSTEKNHTLWESTVGAAGGFVDAVRNEKKIRQVLVATIVASSVCAVADVGYFQILMVLFSWVVSFICETFNTAIEKAVDYSCGTQYHPLIREAKDYASACTFVSLIFAGSLTLFVLYDRLF